MKLYPSQVRKGDVLTFQDYTGYPPRTHKVTVTGDPQEAPRNYFTGERRISLPVDASYATLWRDEVTYTAKFRIEVERP